MHLTSPSSVNYKVTKDRNLLLILKTEWKFTALFLRIAVSKELHIVFPATHVFCHLQFQNPNNLYSIQSF